MQTTPAGSEISRPRSPSSRRSGERYGSSSRGIPPGEHRETQSISPLDPEISRALKSVHVLVVDDEPTLRESCANLLRSEGCEVTVCGRGDEALELLRRRPFDILFVDLHISHVAGMELLEAAKATDPDVVGIVMTGNPTVSSSIEVRRAGAFEYIPKPFSALQLQIVLGRAAHAVVEARKISQARRSLSAGHQHSTAVNLMGAAPNFLGVIERARRVARSGASVFLTGESGTGKEVIAHFIHAESRRAKGTMVPVNCAGLPESLFESEMFGHVKGAFTGAVSDKKGLLEAAHGGTLFLDELTEMPAMIQAKFLRVLQDGVVRRVGSTRTDAVVDVRVVVGTNQDPAEAVENGQLRRDLFYRLRVVPIHIPPLRERQEDILIFAQNFLTHFWTLYRGREEMPTLSTAALDALRAWPWQGNVRELRNVMEHAVVMMPPGIEIRPENLPLIGEQKADLVELAPLPPTSGIPEEYHVARDDVLARFEVRYLRQIVRHTDGNISEAAKIAKVDRTTLYRLMEKHNLNQQHLLA
jgi:DNA-binding NtrC family response regulator